VVYGLLEPVQLPLVHLGDAGDEVIHTLSINVHAHIISAIGTQHNPTMHTTPTVDYVVLLRGELTMLLDEEEGDQGRSKRSYPEDTGHPEPAMVCGPGRAPQLPKPLLPYKLCASYDGSRLSRSQT
jgi:hypothetical protein